MAAVLMFSPGVGLGGAAPADAQQTIGLPTFTGPDPVPPEPAPFTVDNTMRAIFEADLANGDGTDFWMDRLLARQGSDPAGNQLLTRGRALFMATHNPNVIGFGGQVAYWDVINGQSAYTVTVGGGGFGETVSQRVQKPSHWRGVYTSGSLQVQVTKFITENNVAVTNLAITNNGGTTQNVPIQVSSPHATTATGAELTSTVNARRGLTTLFPRLSGDGLTAQGSTLTGSVMVAPGATVQRKVQMGFVTNEIEQSRPEYDAIRAATPNQAFTNHVRTYNEWWADNVPYIDLENENIKKFVYYRWFIARFNFLDADIPGNDFQFPVSIEGVLGFNNAIALTTPMFIDETKYFRDPLYSYGNWLSAGEQSEGQRYADNPGEPDNWNDSYLQYTTDAAWRAYQVHGGQPAILRNLARYGEGDVKSQLAFHNLAGNPNNNPNLQFYCCNFLNGNDADNPSFAFFNRGNERVESAYMFANANATADIYDLLGQPGKAAEMRQIAGNVQDAILNTLWDPQAQEFRHRDLQTNSLIPWKEINNYYPFTVGLVPDQDQFTDSLDLFGDPSEYPVFPFYTANQADKAAAVAAGRGGSNNFSQINSTVQFRLASSVIRNYDTNNTINEEWYEQLLHWNAWAHFIGGDTRWPDSNEFWFNWNPNTQTFGRSGIHHSQLGSSNWTVIEDVAGLRPRVDDNLELWPIDVDFDHFAVNNVRYHNRDLTIVWDQPGDGQTHYPGVPEGYSAYLDGQRVFTVNNLTRVVYNPATGQATLPDGGGQVVFQAAGPNVATADQVQLTGERVIDMFEKAGVHITKPFAGGGGGGQNLALSATPSASSTSPWETVTAINDGIDPPQSNDTQNPRWGTWPNSGTQWVQLTWDQPVTVGASQMYFFQDVPDTTDGGVKAPASWSIQYWNGQQFVNVPNPSGFGTALNQFNTTTFDPVTTTQLRATLQSQTFSGSGGVGVLEWKVAATATGGEADPTGNLALGANPSASFVDQAQATTAYGPTSVGAAVDGFTINIPFWGAAGSGNAQDWYELNFGQPTTFDEVNLYFFNDREQLGVPDQHRVITNTNRYREPAFYTIQVFAGGQWVNIAGQAKQPANPRSNFNRVEFEPVTAERVRVMMTHRQGFGTGLKEIQVFNDGGPSAVNVAPAAQPTCSNTSPWESCAAINDEANPNGPPQYGTWPTTGNQWVQLTWNQPVEVDSANLWFFQDVAPGASGGVQAPASWNIQWWNGQQFQNVTNPQGFRTELNRFNKATFDPVTTTQIRANLIARPNQAAQEGIGVREWQVLATSS